MNVSTKMGLSAIAHKPMLTFWQQQVARFGDGFILKSLSPSDATGDRRALTIPFGKEVSNQIAKRCGNNPHALYICYLTTLSVVLRTYEDTPQVIIHSPLYGQEGNGELTYAETVPVGLALNDECSLREHLRINQEMIKQLFAYQQFPLATLRKNAGETLASNVLFGTDTLHRPTSPATRQRYDLVIDMWVSEDGVVINYEFVRNRFSDEFVRAFHRHWAAVLAYMDRPETPIRNISLLNEQAYKTVVEEFNHPTTSWSSEGDPATIPALFERQAALTPDATAVIFDGQTLTYRQLNEASTQLAYLLQNEYQVGPEDRVGIMLDRSEWLIVSLLGVMKAGAAYVPVDVSYPSERKQYILDDAAPKLLLTKSDYLFDLPGYTAPLLAIDIQLSVRENELPTLNQEADPSNLAYIIYTSGSTGKPKGVGVEHRSVANTLIWRKNFCGFTATDVTLQLLSFTFDGSVLDIFTTLTSGGSVVMVPDEKRTDPVYLLDKIKQHGVTNLLVVPSQYRAFLEEFGTELTQLRSVTVAGEATTDSLRKLHFETIPHVALCNEYGPTENAVCSSGRRLTADGPITIGQPVTNTQVYIVDAYRKPVPVGVLGEIALAGVGLARGYWNLPELTAEKFVPNTVAPNHEGRMYLTGDLGYWTPEGEISYRGRKDHQVKVRGFRIELGEIENAIRACEGVNEAVVVDRQDATGMTYLTAYVTGQNTAFDTRTVTTSLQAQLPDYMVPQYIMKLAQLPITAIGKLDRKALPDPVTDGVTSYAAPTTPTEQLLVDVWCGVLGKVEIGVEADFFGEGGDSIKAIQVAARVHKAGYQLEVKDIFKHLVLRDLAAFLAMQKQQTDAQQPKALPLTPAQQPWVGIASNPYRTAILRSDKPISATAVGQALTNLSQRYDTLRLVFQAGETGYTQAVDTQASTVPVQEHTIPTPTFSRELYEDYLAELIDSSGANQPLMQAGVFHLVGQEYLTLSVHRAVVDPEAWAILLTDFVRLLNGNLPDAAETYGSYFDWVGQVQTFNRSEAIQKQTAFWKQQLSPTDAGQSSGQKQGITGNTYVRFTMGKDIVDDLLVRANLAFNTNTGQVVLTAFKLTMSDVFNTNNALVWLSLSARDAFMDDANRPFSPVGNYLAPFPLRLAYDGNRNLPYHLKVTKEQVNQVPARGLGYGLLNNDSSRTEQLVRSERPQPTFTYIPPVLLEKSDVRLDEALTDEFETASFPAESSLHVVAKAGTQKLTVTIYYDPNVYSIDTAQTFRNRLEYNLLKLIVLCATQEHQELTPSDYGNQNMSLDDLEHINALYE